MDPLAADDIFLFSDFRLDARRGGLFRSDDGDIAVPVTLGGRALDVLRVLVGRPGDVVSRDEIITAVWPMTIVEDNNLNIQIAALRRVLDNGREQESCIQTVAGRGYQFVARVTKPETAERPAVAAASYAGARPRLSIVVLPFANLSDDSEQQYFADGITDDVIADLSRIDGSFVISRGTAFTYKGKALDAKQIGRELGVRFVLEGSARRSGNLVRVNAQLIDAETAGHLWAERFDRDIGDLFAVQDEITRRIATALNLELAWAEAARPFEHPDALDYFFRGRAAGAQAKTRDNHAEAIALYEHALALDPQSVAAKIHLASELAGRVLNNMTDSSDADVARAAELAGQALAAAPRSPSAHFAKGQALRAQGRPAEAIPEYETVIAFDRNAAYAISTLGYCKFLAGFVDETIPLQEEFIRLSPRDPYLGFCYQRIGLAHLVQSRIDDAILWLEKAREAMPAHPNMRANLASAYALEGETERAVAELIEARRLSSDDRFSSIARLRAITYFGVPAVHALYEATYFVGLRHAGMAEE